MPLALVLAVSLSGCVSLDRAFLPERVLDQRASNGWVVDPGLEEDVHGGAFSKQALVGYRDEAEDGRGFRGVLVIESFRGLLSPDREALRERAGESLRDQARELGLALESAGRNGERTLANGARSFYIVVNATARDSGPLFDEEARVKMVGEVFRCTGGATVVVTGSAQIDTLQSIGGLDVRRVVDTTTWREMVQDPRGSIEGHMGSLGLLHNVACA